MQKISLNSNLSRAIEGLSPRNWAKMKAIDLRKLSGQEKSDRVDLISILKLRKIQRPIKSDKNLGCKAKLIPDKNGFRVAVDDSLVGKFKKPHWRFTIAHEIGHTFFFDLNQSPPSRFKGLILPEDAEEKLCDLFATELLMDEQLVKRNFRNMAKRPIFEVIKTLASKFDVSFDAMSLRVVRGLGLWQGILLVCRWLDKKGFTSNKVTEPAWRVYWSIYPDWLNSEIFIPKPVSYRKFYPTLKWSAIEQLAIELKREEAREISISAQEIGKLGNLRKILAKYLGERREYSLSATIIDNGNNDEKNKFQAARKKTIGFAISINKP